MLGQSDDRGASDEAGLFPGIRKSGQPTPEKLSLIEMEYRVFESLVREDL